MGNELMVRIHPDCKNDTPILTPAKPGDVGYDLRAWVENEAGVITINPQRMVNIRTGVFVKLPEGYWGDIRSRSSTFLKRNLFVMSATIDNGYTGEQSTVVWNPTLDPHQVQNGDRLAQLVVLPSFTPKIHIVENLPVTKRGATGFGSTNKE